MSNEIFVGGGYLTEETGQSILAALGGGAVIDAGNSTTTPLGGAATFTGTGLDVSDRSEIMVLVFADVTGTLNIDWSQDDTNYDVTDTIAVSASTGLSYRVSVKGQYYRVRYVNDAGAQATFRLESIVKSGPFFSDEAAADLAAINASTASIDTDVDVALSTRASEVTAAAILADTAAIDTATASIDASVDVALSTRASEVTAAAILADTANIDTNVATLAGTVAGSEQQVDIVGALPAGTNNIGDVDIASALPAGTNNIGDVDIASALPAGTNNIGDVDVLTLPDVAQATASNLNAQVVGEIASNAADSGNPVKVGGVYNSSLPTFDDGDRVAAQFDVNGRQLVAGSFSSTAAGVGVVSDFRRNCATSNLVADTWVEVDSSTSSASVFINVSNTSGVPLEIGTGTAASEVKLFSVSETGEDPLQIEVASSTRISVRSVDSDATSGNVIVTILG